MLMCVFRSIPVADSGRIRPPRLTVELASSSRSRTTTRNCNEAKNNLKSHQLRAYGLVYDGENIILTVWLP
jgi:hypothetical protein